MHRELFDALDRCESILGSSRYLLGDRLTEADVRLFMTLVRFDHVSGRGHQGVCFMCEMDMGGGVQQRGKALLFYTG
jgi:glutathionyl-hydroquinone reductase